MAKPVLVTTRRLPPAIEARASRDYDARLRAEDTALDAAGLLRLAEGAAAIICCVADPMNAAIIQALPASIRAIGTFSVGYDHIDLAAAAARSIPVCNTPDVLSVCTAECALALILAAGRQVGAGERMVRSGQWAGWAPTQLLGSLISGRRLGIFGMGRIGRELARMAAGLNMRVHYHDIARLPPELEMGAIFHADEASFLAASDVLSLHAPGGPGTHRWLNQARLAQLPHGAIVVNAARGSLVDDAALIAALRSGQVAFAGLDVYDGEPKVNPGYLTLENVVLLPHLGSNAAETRDAMGNLVLDGIDAILAGRTPANLVR
jgi:lactate dehydrogenase-like 2-hydroxyacid dehydrogenase